MEGVWGHGGAVETGRQQGFDLGERLRLRQRAELMAQVRIGVDRIFAFGLGRAIASGTFADVERAVRLHPCAGRVTPPAQAGAPELSRCTGQGDPRRFHEVVED